MPQMKQIDGGAALFEMKLRTEKKITDEEFEDRQDYCAAVEAIDEALEKGGMKRTRDFAKELGFDF